MDTAGRICYHQEKTEVERRENNRMNPLIFQSDFGRADGAVSAMYGVAYSVCRDLKISDLTHEIPQYDIWEASYRLIQTVSYWPEGAVFVSVVDPGVGSNRRSIVARTEGGHYVVTPDNGEPSSGFRGKLYLPWTGYLCLHRGQAGFRNH